MNVLYKYLNLEIRTWSLIIVPFYYEVNYKQKYEYNTHKTTHTELYIDSIISKVIAHITATYKISEH